MRLLVVGGGGREHAIIWKLAQSKRIKKLYCAPGNAGTALLAENVPLKATDLSGIVTFSQTEGIDLVFVAPDDPLALGLVDRLNEAGIRAFGPTAKAARIEASKSYAKQLMASANIPTALYRVFTDVKKAKEYIARSALPIVIKADGLALGKGVTIAYDYDSAIETLEDLMCRDRFGSAGHKVLIEEYLSGPELTVMAFTDGITIRPMPTARDFKRVGDGDTGPNTGGMGAISPGAELSCDLWRQMQEQIFEPTIAALNKDKNPFQGVIYFGLMLTADGPKVIEYNARFGDPETQAVLPLLENDLLEIIEAVIDRRLAEIEIKWQEKASCCVVLSSGGYPDDYKAGYPIEGLANPALEGFVFHAGTSCRDGQIVTGGGRVLGVTAIAKDRREAVTRAYAMVQKIRFNDMFYRKDIGKT